MELLNRYQVQARVYPGLLMALPILALAAATVPRSLVAALTSTLAASGVLFLTTNIVRSRGLKAEARLIQQWGGFPTTRSLRHADSADDVRFSRRRRKLENVYGERLPDVDYETSEPERSDSIYVAAIRALISRFDGIRERFPRVEDENINYGFRRNLLGMKPYGIFVAAGSLAVDLLIGISGPITVALIAATTIHVSLLGVWITVVNPTWVREAADRYADRLFEALDALDDSETPDIEAS